MCCSSGSEGAAPKRRFSQSPRPKPSSLRAFSLTWPQSTSWRPAARAAGSLGLAVLGDGARHDRTLTIGLGLFVEGVAPAYLPIRHRYLGAPKQLPLAELTSLCELLEDADFSVVTHDAKTATKLLARDGIALRGVTEDTLVAAYLVDPSSRQLFARSGRKDVSRPRNSQRRESHRQGQEQDAV